MGAQAKPNELLRFKLTGAEEELVDVDQSESGVTTMKGVVHGLRFDKRCSKLRPMADTWSKVNDACLCDKHSLSACTSVLKRSTMARGKW